MSFYRDNQESILEIKEKLVCANNDLESAKEEIRNTEETIKQLLQLLKTVCKERDEARDQLLKLLNKISPSTPADNGFDIINAKLEALAPFAPSESSFAISPETSFFTHTDHLSNSFVNGCFSNAISSSDFSNQSQMGESKAVIPMQALARQMSMSKPVVQGQNSAQRTNYNPMQGIASEIGSSNPALMIINELSKGKPPPQKGKFYQAVIDAGPLLLNHPAAELPLPRWKNFPPPFMPREVDQCPKTPNWALNKNVGILDSLSSRPLHQFKFS